MDFDVADIRPAREAQVVAGMYYDRRVFLVVNAGAGDSLVIALMPHQAEAVGRDLVDGVIEGEVHRHRIEPRAVPVAIKPAPGPLLPPPGGWAAPAVRIVRDDLADGVEP